MQTRRAAMILASLAALLLGSCAGGFGQAASDRLDRMAAFSPRDLLPLRVPIVRARQDDLQELPLGSQRAIAYNRKRGASILGARATFIEPLLPLESDSQSDLGVLPARPQ
jgi:hypothetical protein